MEIPRKILALTKIAEAYDKAVEASKKNPHLDSSLIGDLSKEASSAWEDVANAWKGELQNDNY